MTWLKKFGAIVLKATEVIAGFSPIVSQVYPKATDAVQVVSKDLAQIGTIITEVEAVGQALGLAGTQKLQAAAPLVANVILDSALLANHKIANADLFKQGSQKIADGMADILNSLDAGSISTVDKTA